jgi:hypothetical protein
MEPLSAGVLSGVVANGLTTVISHLSRVSTAALKRNGDAIRRDRTLSALLQGATTEVARRLAGEEQEGAERLKLFIASADVDAIIRQIYATKLTGKRMSLTEIRTEFSECFRLHHGALAPSMAACVTVLLETLIAGCDRALEIAVSQKVLSAHDAKSAARANLILDELEAIKARIDFTTKGGKLNVGEIDDFDSNLRGQIALRHAFIVPPHFDARRRVPIDELYVTPTFSRQPRRRGPQGNPQELSLDEVLGSLYRTVVLGNPGSGKSTLATKICHDLAANYPDAPLGGRRVTPVLVPLRDYGRERKEKGLSIAQFIETVCNSTYQVSPPPRAVEYLLRTGRIFVLFDGLDELLDTSYRQKISEDVEAFCGLYPGIPALVTSREVGYEQAPLDENRFDTIRIAPFQEKQVAEYVAKWYAADSELNERQQKEKAGSFLKESASVPDLRTNPLMLALMCNIYRGENYIPRNRPDVYEKCALMLFEKWDKSRGINVPLPFEAHVRPAMMHLAHWVFGDEGLRGGVTEGSLVEKCTEYLCPRRYEDSDDARRAAGEFIEFCRGRAWVFTDTGTTAQGERLYQFTHRTFLEYFTAAHLVRTHPTPADLGGSLIPRIAVREWDVVAQLAFQLQNKQVEGAGDALLTAVLRSAVGAGVTERQRTNLLSFASRSLEFLVPSPSLVREVVDAVLEHCISVGAARLASERTTGSEATSDGDATTEVVGPLLAAAEENRAPIARQVAGYLERGLAGEDSRRSALTLQLAANLPFFLYHGTLRSLDEVDPKLVEYWEQLMRGVISANGDRVRAVCRGDFATCVSAVFTGHITPTDMVTWHGVQSLFARHDTAICPFMGGPPIIPYVACRIAEMYAEDSDALTDRTVAAWRGRLAEVGAILVQTEPPWVGVGLVRSSNREWGDHPQRTIRKVTPQSLRKMGADHAFLVFVCCALDAEILPTPPGAEADPEKDAEQGCALDFCRLALLGRQGRAAPDQFRAEIARLGFSEQQWAIISGWADGTVSFVGRVRKG